MKKTSPKNQTFYYWGGGGLMMGFDLLFLDVL
jgi:hypothetical protein